MRWLRMATWLATSFGRLNHLCASTCPTVYNKGAVFEDSAGVACECKFMQIDVGGAVDCKIIYPLSWPLRADHRVLVPLKINCVGNIAMPYEFYFRAQYSDAMGSHRVWVKR